MGGMDVEISPEPGEQEREAILAALAEEPEPRLPAAGGWAGAGLEEPLEP
jgi:hypothetical protein